VSTAIHLETEAVLRAAQQLQEVSAVTGQELQGLHRAISSIAWSGGSADEFRVELRALVRRLMDLCQQGEILGQRMEREVQEWLAVDGQGASSFGSLARLLPEMQILERGRTLGASSSASLLQTPSLAPWFGMSLADAQGTEATDATIIDLYRQAALALAEPFREAKKAAQTLNRVWKAARPLAGAVLVAGSMKPGYVYPEEVIIDLPDWLRQFQGLREIRRWAGFPGHLNHIAASNLPSKMLKWGVVFSVPSILEKWRADLRTYEGTELASAMIVDCGLTLAPVFAGYAAAETTKVGFVILGTVLFGGNPAGAVVGYGVAEAASELIAGSVVQLCTEWAIDHYGVRERAIDRVDGFLRSTIESITAASQQVIPREWPASVAQL